MIITHDYVMQCIAAYNEVFNFPHTPQVMVIYGESDNCGMMNIFATEFGGNITKDVMYIYPDAIEHTALVDGVDSEQMALETIFHEYIHYFIHMSGGDLFLHGGKIWDSMVTIAMHNGFIHRREI